MEPRGSISRRAVLAALSGATLAGAALTACGASAQKPRAASSTPTPTPPPSPTPAPSVAVTRAEIVAQYGKTAPTSWGFDAPGVLTRLPDRSIALTFDACGGPGGSGYDAALIELLRSRKVPATLFLNSRWIDANPAAFHELAADPLFEIGNHGTQHRPLSVTGRSAYNIPGTRDAGEVFDEVEGNHEKLTALLGHPPRFFRSGTAYYDDVAAQIVTALGERCAGFSVNGDAGATFTADQVRRTVLAAGPGSIVIGHMNHPTGGTARGTAGALPQLLDAGQRFVRLSDAAR